MALICIAKRFLGLNWTRAGERELRTEKLHGIYHEGPSRTGTTTVLLSSGCDPQPKAIPIYSYIVCFFNMGYANTGIMQKRRERPGKIYRVSQRYGLRFIILLFLRPTKNTRNESFDNFRFPSFSHFHFMMPSKFFNKNFIFQEIWPFVYTSSDISLHLVILIN